MQTHEAVPYVYCPNCRGGNPPEARNCMWCGAVLLAADKPTSQRSSRSWIWVSLGTLVVASLAVLLFAAFVVPGFALQKSSSVSGTVAGQTIDALGVVARLPSSDWQPPTTFSPSGSTGKMWIRFDARRLFTISQVTAVTPKSDAELQAFVTGFARTALVPPYTTDRVQFHGYSAIRLEGVMSRADLPGDYHAILMFFTANTRLYYLSVAARASDWDSSGRSDAQSILDSVQVR